MKTIFAIIFMLAVSGVYAQDTLKIRQIDALVSAINNSPLPIKRDTLIQNTGGLKMTTYLSMIMEGGELLKYVNHVNMAMLEKGVSRKMTASNTFYYSHNKLIKVEEYMIEGDEKTTFDWYYSDDKPLYATVPPEKAGDRATVLLTMSKAMLKAIIK
jgi:hypothetical protein